MMMISRLSSRFRGQQQTKQKIRRRRCSFFVFYPSSLAVAISVNGNFSRWPCPENLCRDCGSPHRILYPQRRSLISELRILRDGARRIQSELPVKVWRLSWTLQRLDGPSSTSSVNWRLRSKRQGDFGAILLSTVWTVTRIRDATTTIIRRRCIAWCDDNDDGFGFVFHGFDGCDVEWWIRRSFRCRSSCRSRLRCGVVWVGRRQLRGGLLLLLDRRRGGCAVTGHRSQSSTPGGPVVAGIYNTLRSQRGPTVLLKVSTNVPLIVHVEAGHGECPSTIATTN